MTRLPSASPKHYRLSHHIPARSSNLSLILAARSLVALFLATLFLATLFLASPAVAQEKAPQVEKTQKTTKKRAAEPAWQPLFNGKSLKGWKIAQFGGQGEVLVKDGRIEMEMGSSLTGITYDGKLPKCDYELQVEAMRIDGIDFFSTITFPVRDSFCSLVVGGWAGSVVGLSCIDGADASENETQSYQRLKSNQWYRIRIQVRKDRIRAWIDDKQVVDFETKDHKLETRVEVCLCEPLGIACWETVSGIRKIEIRTLPAETGKKATPKKKAQAKVQQQTKKKKDE